MDKTNFDRLLERIEYLESLTIPIDHNITKPIVQQTPKSPYCEICGKFAPYNQMHDCKTSTPPAPKFWKRCASKDALDEDAPFMWNNPDSNTIPVYCFTREMLIAMDAAYVYSPERDWGAFLDAYLDDGGGK